MLKKTLFTGCLIASLWFALFQQQKTVTEVNMSSSFYPETVIIDPGHGGEDSGAIGKKIYLEKDINLDISQKLELIFNLHGINTDMTRRDDVSLGENTSEFLRRRKSTDLKKRIEKRLNL